MVVIFCSVLFVSDVILLILYIRLFLFSSFLLLENKWLLFLLIHHVPLLVSVSISHLTFAFSIFSFEGSLLKHLLLSLYRVYVCVSVWVWHHRQRYWQRPDVLGPWVWS